MPRFKRYSLLLPAIKLREPTSRGLSAGSMNLSTSLDPADKPRDVGEENGLNLMAVPLLLLLCISGVTTQAFAHRWQCLVSDSAQKSWSYSSNYRKTALNQALYACKKKSSDPVSCNASMSNCDVVSIDINSHKSLWQCTALDFHAVSFSGKIAYYRDEAAISALNDCKQYSKQPDSCYIRLFSCEDLTKGNF